MPYKEYLMTNLGCILMILLSTGLFYLGKEPLYEQDWSNYNVTPFWILLCCQQIMFAHMTFNCDVCATTAMRYSPWNNRFCLVTILYCSLVCIANIFTGNKIFKICSLYGLLFIAVASYTHYVGNIIYEMCESLEIKVFTVKPKFFNLKEDADMNTSIKPKNS